MNRTLYSWLWWLATPLIALYLLWRSRQQPAYRQHWRERWGWYELQTACPLIWVHAVSVGETQAAQPLIEALLKQYPNDQILLTHMTPTGRAMGEHLFADAIAQGRLVQCYLPYDYAETTHRFLSYFSPRLGVLLETEIWPNLLHSAEKLNIPVALVNARLSEKSLQQGQRWQTLIVPALQSLQVVAAQTHSDAARLRELGVHKVVVTGNLKFDVHPDLTKQTIGQQWRQQFGARPVLLAASTREGEEALLLEQLNALNEQILLLIVPRHPQRFSEVAQLLRNQNIRFVTRSTWSGHIALPTHVRVLLGDSMGEMPAYYAASDLAFIGGSLLPLGGQNLIEACACECPVLFGPHMFNFALASQLAIECGAARQINNTQELFAEANQLLTDTTHSGVQLQAMRAAAQRFAEEHRGATALTLQLLNDLLAPGTTHALLRHTEQQASH